MLRLMCIVVSLGLIKGQAMLGPIVNTKRGPIRGLKAEYGDYYMYLGIPYGQLGENPFEIAHPYPKFEKTFNAYNDSCACPQFDDQTYFGTLDCLCLHIFVPTSASKKNKLPVMIMIHGGMFSRGYTARHYYGPHNMVVHGVIFVVFNFRLGPYGFMCLDTPQMPGNQALKDQRLALRWIKENIASFGGDVNKITLMGESSGSICAEIHLLSTEEQLFHRVILESGAAVKPGIVVKSDVTEPLKLAKQLGFKTNNITEALSFLSSADPLSIIKAYEHLSMSPTICVEKEFENVEGILLKHPWNLDAPKVKSMEILSGYTDREGLLLDARNKPGYFIKKNYIRDTLAKGFNTDANFNKIVNVVRRFYFGDEDLTEELRSKVIDFQSDFFFNYPIQWTLEKFLKNGAKALYQYLFPYTGGMNIIRNKYNITKPGAAHGDEVEYLFVMRKYKTSETSAEDELMSERLTTLWTNFAKYGNPTPYTTELLPVKWLPITENVTNYLVIDKELSMGSMGKRPFSDRLSFWEVVITRNRRSLKGYQNYY